MSLQYSDLDLTETEQDLSRLTYALALRLGLLAAPDYDQRIAAELASSIMTVRTLEQSGVDLTSQRTVEMWCNFDKRKAAMCFVRALATRHPGFRTTVSREPGGPLTVHIEGQSELRLDSLARLKVSIVRLTRQNGGRYDGFQALLQ